jgi:phenylpropionate dioxygenase-like ring-hydroxylating dioxygenase large terminal subunit
VADWHRACGSDELKTLPRSVRIEGREVVVWRLPDGGVAALDDRCTHQWVRLSVGMVLPDGCIMCPSHGWTFNPDGTNALLSWGDRVPAHEAREEAGEVLVRLRHRSGGGFGHP